MPPAMKLQDTSNVNPLITQILDVFATSKGAFLLSTRVFKPRSERN